LIDLGAPALTLKIPANFMASINLAPTTAAGAQQSAAVL
jgi:hypothetical protein